MVLRLLALTDDLEQVAPFGMQRVSRDFETTSDLTQT